MTNTSATGGYLLPSTPQLPTPAAPQDSAFDTLLQNFIVGLTGLPGSLVWPAWQVVIPNLPPVTTNWASFVVSDSETPGFIYEAHDPVFPPNGMPPATSPAPATPPTGYDITIEHEELVILVSFYGPNARGNAALMRSGLQVPQNREVLQLNGMGLISANKITTVPSIVNNQSYYRVDLPVRLRREIVRNYPVLDIASSQITVKSDTGATATVNPS